MRCAFQRCAGWFEVSSSQSALHYSHDEECLHPLWSVRQGLSVRRGSVLLSASVALFLGSAVCCPAVCLVM